MLLQGKQIMHCETRNGIMKQGIYKHKLLTLKSIIVNKQTIQHMITWYKSRLLHKEDDLVKF
jgi:hypothetical protein